MAIFAQTVRRILRPLVPPALLEARKRILLTKLRRKYSQLSASATFAEVYKTNAWGGPPGTFSSGSGSDDAFSIPYCRLVADFVRSHAVTSIVDLGVGDFRVGSQLIQLIGDKIIYSGVDIVPELIDYNRAHFESPTVTFHCLNLIDDKLPAGTLCLLRQVLQHLSNSEILQALNNCAGFKYTLITEHVTLGSGAARPNIDKPHGPDTRNDLLASGVFVDKPPFSLATSVMLEIPLCDNQLLRTVLVERREA